MQMSLGIDIDRVTSVLLAGRWYQVKKNSEGVSTFDIDAYEFVEGDCIRVGGGTVPGVPATGFSFETSLGSIVVGPLTSIQAVKVAVGLT